jgi:hypothetical protein
LSDLTLARQTSREPHGHLDRISRSAVQAVGRTVHLRKELTMNAPRIIRLVAAIGLMALTLTGCGPGVEFIAPEIEPPADLIPGHVPKGFELVSGFELKGGVARGGGDGEVGGGRGPFPIGLVGPLEVISSPAGNVVQGIQYRKGDTLILITKSSFPGGDLDLWWEAVQASGPNGGKDCECETPPLLLNMRRLQLFQIVEEREVGGVRVAIVDGLLGSWTVFMRGQDLLTVQGGISEEETLKIVESLLP